MCRKCEKIPPLGKLPNLRVIKLSFIYSLKCFNDEDTNTSKSGDNKFPSLQELHIYDCRNLVSLPSYFPKLNNLGIIYCMSLLSLPDEIQSFKDLKQLHISYCENLRRRYDKEMRGVDWPKISHIHLIRITGFFSEYL